MTLVIYMIFVCYTRRLFVQKRRIVSLQSPVSLSPHVLAASAAMKIIVACPLS